jgi:hypothetical protein
MTVPMLNGDPTLSPMRISFGENWLGPPKGGISNNNSIGSLLSYNYFFPTSFEMNNLGSCQVDIEKNSMGEEEEILLSP